MIKGTVTALICMMLTLLFSSCTSSLPKNIPEGPKTYKNKMNIRIMGARRTYLVHVPPNYSTQKPLPLVVVIHGAFDTAAGMEKYSTFSDLADRENFIIMYPNGMGIFGLFQHWNAGHCCGKAANDDVDDVGFIAAAIDDVRVRLQIDPDRIYMVGFSNGGMLAYRFAAERGDILAAVAPLAASIGGRPSEDAPQWRIPDPVKPLSVITIHGLADDDIVYEGGVSLHRGGTRTFWSVDESVDFWVRHNGCHPNAAETELNQGHVRVRTWGACNDDTEVVLYLIEDWGHVWPGRYFTAELEEADPLKDFDAAEIIWDFFKSHARMP